MLGINDPSVYMHWCGWNVRGSMWLYLAGKGVVMLFLGRGGGFHVLDK